MRYSASGKPDLMSNAKEVREFAGRRYVMEESIRGDVTLIKAWKADEVGNLVFRGTANNFSQPMATAGRVVIAEVEEIVPPGTIDPAQVRCLIVVVSFYFVAKVHVPGIYVDHLVLATRCEKVESSVRQIHALFF